MIYRAILHETFLKFINGKQVNEKSKKLILSKIKILELIGKDWHPVYELKNTDGLFRLEFSRYRIIFFFGKNKEIIVTNAFIEKNIKDYRKAIDIANKIKEEYENG